MEIEVVPTCLYGSNPYVLSGYKWGKRDLTVSFVSDGTLVAGNKSDLMAKYDAVYPRATWQGEFQRALETWARWSGLRFSMVRDGGAPYGSLNPVGGDIRIGGYASAGLYLAYSWYPYSTTSMGGDLVLNTRDVFKIGSKMDLYSVVLHELGHTLGLGHSPIGTAVMYASVTRVYVDLTEPDVQGIQALYGVPLPTVGYGSNTLVVPPNYCEWLAGYRLTI